jgi:hypothetical protein
MQGKDSNIPGFQDFPAEMSYMQTRLFIPRAVYFAVKNFDTPKIKHSFVNRFCGCPACTVRTGQTVIILF